MLADRMDDAIKALESRPPAEPDTGTVEAIDTASNRIAALSETPEVAEQAAEQPAEPVTETAPIETPAVPEAEQLPLDDIPMPDIADDSTDFEADWSPDVAQEEATAEATSKPTAEVEDLHQIIARRRARLNRAIEASEQAKEAGDETD
ncbi:MAG: hypothetical protein ACPGGK_16475, partial [Pikeienuella sp.]